MSAQANWPGRDPEDATHDVVAAFLVTDIQHSPDWSADLVGKVHAVTSGELERWRRLGNAYELVLEPNTSSLEPLEGPDADTPVRFPTETLRSAAIAWHEAVSALADG